MPKYRISGVWKDDNGVITHYGFHTSYPDKGTASRMQMHSKAEAIALLEAKDASATTWLWDYSQSKWKVGEEVEVVGSGSNKYLRTKPDNRLTDNLSHLIDYDWIRKA